MSKLLKWLAFSFLLTVLFSTSVFAVDCPSAETVAARLTRSEELLNAFHALAGGNGRAGNPIQALFTIDLDDNQAIQRRINELTLLTQSESQSKLYLGCALTKKMLTDRDQIEQNENELNKIRLEILKMPPEIRNNLFRVYQETIKQKNAISAAEETQKHSQALKIEAQIRLENVERLTQENTIPSDKDLLAWQTVLEKYRQDLADTLTQLSQAHKTRVEEFAELTSALSDMAAFSVKDRGQQEINMAYSKVNFIWRRLVDGIFDRVHVSNLGTVPNLPNEIGQLKKTDYSDEAQNRFQESIELARKDRHLVLENIEADQNMEKEIAYSLLIKTGEIRAYLLNESLRFGTSYVYKLEPQTARDILREIKIVPFRSSAFVISKIVEFNAKIRSGIEGWIDIARQVVYLFFILLIPLFLFKAMVWITNMLDGIRQNLISKSTIHYKYRTAIALWINRIKPLLPWAIVWLVIVLTEQATRQSSLSEIATLTPFARIYVYYRIFRILVSNVMSRLLVRGSLENLRRKTPELQNAVRRIGLLLFSEMAVLHATEATVRRALIYDLVSEVVIYINVFYLILQINRWKSEIVTLSEELLPTKLHAGLLNLSKRKISRFFVPTLMFCLSLIWAVLNALIKIADRFEFFKKITSEIFKRKIQIASDDSQTQAKRRERVLSKEYAGRFALDSQISSDLYVPLNNDPLSEIENAVKKWAVGELEEDSIIVYGDAGIGKTAMVKELGIRLAKTDLQEKTLTIHPKVTTPEEFYQLLSGVLGKPIQSAAELPKLEVSLPKTVIIIDQAHHLFLGKLGGFDAYRTLVDLISLQTTNLFWCLVFNLRSWDYLTGVFGQAHIFCKEFALKSWSDHEIQSLIMRRHRKSGYRMTFDNVISAFQKEDTAGSSSQLEAQFFRLLWGQSRGNPRTALLLWLSAIHQMDENMISVGVPNFTRITGLSSLDQETLFTFAAIVRHGSLDPLEIARITNLPDNVVRRCVKLGEDMRIIERITPLQCRVTPDAQYFVVNYLLGKNFLYE